MTWLAQNWIWIIFAVAFVAMHMFGHGGHGGHSGHGGHGSESSGRGDASEAQPARNEGARHAAPPASGGPHRH